MMMSELISQMQEAVEAYGDKKVYAAIQPNYPIVVSITGIGLTLEDDSPDEARENAAEQGLDFDPEVKFKESEDAIYWINTGSSPYDINPYAPRSAWDPIF